ncbi:MAG TPA: cellobiose phosphorylase [Halanaerobiales bacterium]|nr:cellobiose phosphorylase [Halanaerobiales bacterium]
MEGKNTATGWKFIDEDGTFTLSNPQKASYLYFPLANEAGMMSVVTPGLAGDIKDGQNSFLLKPVTVEDLHESRNSRNFWLYIKGYGPWSATGISARQIQIEEDVELKAGFLWHQVSRINKELNLRVEITSLVPATEDKIELMKVRIYNKGDKTLTIIPTAAVPIYGRSADNIRDHRHVTSLLNRIKTEDFGISLSPALSFDERGHFREEISYGIYGNEDTGELPAGFFPLVEDFIGEGGYLDWPRSVVENSREYVGSGEQFAGFEAMGGIRFRERVLKPGQSKSYNIIMIINRSQNTGELAEKYLNNFSFYFKKNRDHWKNKLSKLILQTGDKEFDNWIKWITLQPILRKIYGCSFLPHHDYGRGGRGWRDLWQDCMAIILLEPREVKHLLYNNFAGVRIDGSNATIIGSQSGDFIADRNNIARVWSDHGAWPIVTVSLYIHKSGDLGFLLEDQTYFRDALVYRSQKIDKSWVETDGYELKDIRGNIYQGSILEHLLLENLTAFYNVGEHNNIKIEAADWNDAFDMAVEKGESVAFAAFYAGNLKRLITLMSALKEKLGIKKVSLAVEIKMLLDSIYDNQIDYDSVEEKNKLLNSYFNTCQNEFKGIKTELRIDDLIKDLRYKVDWLFNHFRQQEWIDHSENEGWFNGYYDNHGRKLEGSSSKGVRMTLTGQVFQIMSGVATSDQIRKIIKAVDHYLWDEKVGGYRLNTDFKELKLDMGRAFGFAYGHKENGAMFSHMAVMYANALYKKGFVFEGYRVLKGIYKHCCDFNKSRIYPGIPEYINPRGRGMYHYLTGSASWYLLTMITQVFGVKGYLGDLILEPRLCKEQFDQNGMAIITTTFAGRQVKVMYLNPQKLEYGEYKLQQLYLNGREIECDIGKIKAMIKRDFITDIKEDVSVIIKVILNN